VPPQRSRRALTLLVAPLVALAVVNLISTALTPALLAHHPLVLLVMNARNRNLVTTASVISIVPFLTVALVRRFLEDPFLYYLGRMYGDAAIRWVENRTGSGGFIIRVIERWFRRAPHVFVFFLPGGLVCVLAGATGMSARTFVLLDVAGTLVVISVVRLVGWTIATPVDALRHFLSDNIVWTTALSISLTAAWLVYQRRRGATEIESVGEVVEELEELDEQSGES
jgi:membrane protein DedA with SNARE-associated domain